MTAPRIIEGRSSGRTSPVSNQIGERGISTTVTPEIHAKFERQAKAKGISNAALAREVLTKFCNVEEE